MTSIPEHGSFFAKIVVSSTGSLDRTSREIKSLMEKYGGTYSNMMHSQVTHLIATQKEFDRRSPKIIFAQNHSIPIVTESWLDDCVAHSKVEDVKSYLIGSTSGSKRKRTAFEKIENSKMDEEENEDMDGVFEDEQDLIRQKMKHDQEHYLNIANTFRTLVDDKLYADLMFVVPESLLDPKKTKTIFAHTYLAARCEFLKTQIENSTTSDGKYLVVPIPKVEYKLFYAFLEVLYTGRCSTLDASTALEVIEMCETYDLPELARGLRNQLSSIDEVALLLDASILAQKHSMKRFCLDTIAKHTEKVLKSSSFKTISIHALEAILDSNILEVSESTLFEAVVEWADHQIGHTYKTSSSSSSSSSSSTSTSEWIYQDKQQLAKARSEILAPVIEKIRFPLMTSEELHTVVEPYEVVPKKLLVEAYRFQASPDAFEKNNIRFRSRGGSTAIKWMKGTWLAKVRSWIDGYVSHKLVYIASIDGFSNATWRSKCNGEPGFVVVKTTTGRVFGGYTELGFQSNRNAYSPDPKAFLFFLSDGTAKKKPAKLLQQGSAPHAIFDHVSYGPTFGSGHDLNINFDTKAGQANQGNSYIAPEPFMLAGSNQFTIEDALYFTVKLRKNK